jgi:hypothetical protein
LGRTNGPGRVVMLPFVVMPLIVHVNTSRKLKVPPPPHGIGRVGA